MSRVIMIAHNVRSCHNVGSMLRTAEGLGIEKVYLTGYTPYPLSEHDTRMPHIARKLDAQIHKTALDAERLVAWEHLDDVFALVVELKDQGFQIVGLEQSDRSVELALFKSSEKIALIVGREVEGVEPEVIEQCDAVVEIPMRGQKESFNVSVAAAMALYALTYH